MSIAEMSKLRLIGISTEKEKILNVIHRTCTVELKKTDEIENTFEITDEQRLDEESRKLDKLNTAIEIICEHINAKKGKKDYPKDLAGLKGVLDCDYDEFMISAGNEYNVFYIADKVTDYQSRIGEYRAEKTRLESYKKQLSVYLNVEEKFSRFKDTKQSFVTLGTVPLSKYDALVNYFSDKELCSATLLSQTESKAVISFISHKTLKDEYLKSLYEFGFEKCPYEFDTTCKEIIADTENKIKELDEKAELTDKKICARGADLRDMKICADYITFAINKIKASGDFKNTQKTFILEGYVPTKNAVELKNILVSSFDAILVETEEVPRDEFAPTLVESNKVFKTAEFITNMYSAPRYGEIDPNPSVFAFFMIFLGFIMADIGYGLIMFLGGLIACRFIKRETGFKKILRIVSYGGIFTIIWGILFNSLFGFSVLPFTVMPSCFDASGKVDKSHTMLTLLFTMLIGVIHLTAGYIMKGLNMIKQKRYVDAVFDGFLWIPFFVGVVMFASKFLFDFFAIDYTKVKPFLTAVQMPGVYIALASFGVMALGSVRKGKGIGRVAKPFGMAYGLINLVSDILSYARLFGLMLSGIVFAQQFDKLGVGVMTSPVGYVFGALIILIGHVFNLAMSVLGAYIHDSRLQYVEYFGKFYDGEGEIFKPFSSEFNYINLLNKSED